MRGLLCQQRIEGMPCTERSRIRCAACHKPVCRDHVRWAAVPPSRSFEPHPPMFCLTCSLLEQALGREAERLEDDWDKFTSASGLSRDSFRRGLSLMRRIERMRESESKIETRKAEILDNTFRCRGLFPALAKVAEERKKTHKTNWRRHCLKLVIELRDEIGREKPSLDVVYRCLDELMAVLEKRHGSKAQK